MSFLEWANGVQGDRGETEDIAINSLQDIFYLLDHHFLNYGLISVY